MTALFENRELAASVSDKLKVYAQPQRLMILSCLLRGERNVAEIGETPGSDNRRSANSSPNCVVAI